MKELGGIYIYIYLTKIKVIFTINFCALSVGLCILLHIDLIINMRSSSSLVTDLWSQIVLQVTKCLDFVLDNKWLLSVEAQLGALGETGCLVEQVQVVERELLLN